MIRQLNGDVKFLSIVVPTFNNLDGLKRIVAVLDDYAYDDVELIVSDDSVNNDVKNFVLEKNRLGETRLRYLSHTNTNNAVDNWNHGLNVAQGKFVQLIHHDEYPSSRDYLKTVRDRLLSGSPNILILKCFVKYRNKTMNVTIPDASKYFLQHMPEFLLHKNIIGSSACLIVQRDYLQYYDRNLKWFVDVEEYYRLAQGKLSIGAVSHICIFSLYDPVNSITAKLRRNLRKIVKEERAYIERRHNIKIHVSPKILLATLLYYIYRFVLMLKLRISK